MELNQTETELLTLSSIASQRRLSPAMSFKNGPICKSTGSGRSNIIGRRSPAFLILKYGFVVFIILSSIVSLCDINKFKNQSLLLNSNATSNSKMIFSDVSPLNSNTSELNNQSSSKAVRITILDPRMAEQILYYRNIRIPLFVYMIISVTILFSAIFGRILESPAIPITFGICIFLMTLAMLTLCLKDSHLGLLKYSWYVWVVYCIHLCFSIAFAYIICWIRRSKRHSTGLILD